MPYHKLSFSYLLSSFNGCIQIIRIFSKVTVRCFDINAPSLSDPFFFCCLPGLVCCFRSNLNRINYCSIFDNNKINSSGFTRYWIANDITFNVTQVSLRNYFISVRFGIFFFQIFFYLGFSPKAFLFV